MTVLDRFLNYVKVETTSSEASESCPSTAGQKVLGAMLAEELREMGIHDAEMDGHGYVYGTIPANPLYKLPCWLCSRTFLWTFVPSA